MQQTWVWSLGWEDPLEKEMATPSSILAWRISWTEEPGRLQSMGSQRVGHTWVFTFRILSTSLHPPSFWSFELKSLLWTWNTKYFAPLSIIHTLAQALEIHHCLSLHRMLSHVWLFVDSCAVAHQAPLLTEFSSQNTVVGCHFSTLRDPQTQGWNPCLVCLLHWQVDSLYWCHLGSPSQNLGIKKVCFSLVKHKKLKQKKYFFLKISASDTF